MKQLFLIFFLLCSCGRQEKFSHEDPRWIGLSGFAGLAGDRFPCNQYLEELKRSPAPIFSVLYGTFGNDWACVAEFIEQNKDRPHAVEVHFSNERCRFWGRCFEGELLSNLNTESYNHALESKDRVIIGAIQSRMYEILMMLQILGQRSEFTHWILSTGLEDSYSSKAAEQIYTTLKSLWPYELIRSPVDHLPSGIIPNELHGIQVECQPGGFASNDGNTISTTPGLRAYVQSTSACAGVILWQPRAQGVDDEFTRPADRSFSISADDILIWHEFLNLIYGLEYT